MNTTMAIEVLAIDLYLQTVFAELVAMKSIMD